jgi:hypothetical protein
MGDEPMYLGQPAKHMDDLAAAWPDLGGVCGHCQRQVNNADHDGIHRVTPILKGGRGVECKLRGDW